MRDATPHYCRDYIRADGTAKSGIFWRMDRFKQTPGSHPRAPWWARAATGAMIGVVGGTITALVILQGAFVMSFWIGPVVWSRALALITMNYAAAMLFCAAYCFRRKK
jgi:hypothetical protein